MIAKNSIKVYSLYILSLSLIFFVLTIPVSLLIIPVVISLVKDGSIQAMIYIFILAIFFFTACVLLIVFFFYYVEISDSAIIEHIFFKHKVFKREEIAFIVEMSGHKKDFMKDSNLLRREKFIIILRKVNTPNNVCTREEIARRMYYLKDEIIYRINERKRIIKALDYFDYYYIQDGRPNENEER